MYHPVVVSRPDSDAGLERQRAQIETSFRFGHRFPLNPSGEGDEKIGLKEDIETGALHRMMNDPPVPDDAGIVWTTWRSPEPD